MAPKFLAPDSHPVGPPSQRLGFVILLVLIASPRVPCDTMPRLPPVSLPLIDGRRNDGEPPREHAGAGAPAAEVGGRQPRALVCVLRAAPRRVAGIHQRHPGAPAPGGRHNAVGRRQWCGAPGRTLSAVLAHIEGGNEPPLEYPAPSFSRRRGSSWTPRRMDTPSSSSSGSRSSGSTPAAHLPVKPEPQETPRGRRTRVPSPPRGHSRLVKPKQETAALLPVKKEHEAMATDLESGLLWLRQDYVAQEMERQCRALEEIAARRRGRDEGGVIVLSDSDDEVAAPSQPVRSDDPGQGCNKDAPKDGPPSDGDGDDGGYDYTAFYKLLCMNC